MNISDSCDGARRRRALFALAVMLCATLLLGACTSKEPMVAVEVSGYNHMSDDGWYIEPFSVNGASGPNLSPESGGGGFSCCISIPQRWRPGLKARVEWEYSVAVGDTRTPPPPQVTEIEVPDYNAVGPGTVHVHFYPGHRIKVVVGNFGIGHPRYAMSEQDKLPWTTRWELLNHSSMRD